MSDYGQKACAVFLSIRHHRKGDQPDAVIVDRYTVECQTPNDETREEFSAFLDQIAW